MIKGSELARARQAQMFDLVSKAMKVPLTLDDGKVYTPEMLIDFQKAFESFNTPIKKPSEVAVERDEFLTMQGKAAPPAPGVDPQQPGDKVPPPAP
jgi:hypothetical protein